MPIELKDNVIYVSRDIERALGLEPQTNYRIIATKTPYSETLKNKYPDFITLIEMENCSADTAELMECKEAISLIDEDKPLIVVFKNNYLIEKIDDKNNWHIINPKAELAKKVENKISQIEWLGDLAEKYLPTHEIKLGKNLVWDNKPYIIQWAHGHTGDGTAL